LEPIVTVKANVGWKRVVNASRVAVRVMPAILFRQCRAGKMEIWRQCVSRYLGFCVVHLVLEVD
jgi:hypothetical protein